MSRKPNKGLAAAVAAACLALAAPVAVAQQARGKADLVPSDQAVRLYLSQSLSSLARAYQLAQQARQYGSPESFDLDKFIAELGAVADGLQRYLLPQGPALGPHVQVQITGQYLYEGLSRSPVAPGGPTQEGGPSK